MPGKIELRRRIGVRSLRLSVYPDGRVVATVPLLLPRVLIEQFIREKSAWIERKVSAYAKRPVLQIPPRCHAEYLAKKEHARAFVTKRLAELNVAYQFPYKKIAIRNQTSRWGSCSRAGNLNFSYRIVDLSPELADYLLVHELCHVKEMNHSPRFWALVARVVPDFKKKRKLLRAN